MELVSFEESKHNSETNELVFENINYSAIDSKGKRKQINANVSGRALSRDVFAILGPSGILRKDKLTYMHTLTYIFVRGWKNFAS